MRTEQLERAAGRAGWVVSLVVACAVVVATSPAGAIEKTLANDGFTGSGDLICVQGFAVEEIGAARFTAEPGDYPFTIQSVQILLCPDGPASDLVLKIWRDDGSSLPPAELLWEEIVTFTPSTTLLNEVDLSVDNLVIDSGSVRVGIEYLFSGSPPAPGIARDIDGINPSANLIFVPPASWFLSQQLGVTGDWIIRLVVDANEAQPIFADGFESGGTTAWSAVVP